VETLCFAAARWIFFTLRFAIFQDLHPVAIPAGSLFNLQKGLFCLLESADALQRQDLPEPGLVVVRVQLDSRLGRL
jgi:hypothetical protein